MPDLEDRVAALEAMAAHPLIAVESASWSDEDMAKFREEFEHLAGQGTFTHRILPSPPPLTPEQVRHLLRECVTVVKPEETLVIRGRNWTPNQVREYQDAVNAATESGFIAFRVLIALGDELAVVQPEPEFMAEVRSDTFRSGRGIEAVRLTHEPTGVVVEAETRPEAVAKLGRALKRRGIPGAA